MGTLPEGCARLGEVVNIPACPYGVVASMQVFQTCEPGSNPGGGTVRDVAQSIRCVSRLSRLTAGSFSGRTPDSESGNLGSIPSPAANASVAQLATHLLAMQETVGSRPIACSIEVSSSW